MRPSSFKRRIPTASPSPSTVEENSSGTRLRHSIVLPAGIKNATFSSPVPLFSTGITALDDILSGSGLSSGALLTLLPSTGTYPLPLQDSAAADEPLALPAAEPYTELVVAYGVAQGLHARHCNIVVGEGADSFVQRLMARIGDEDDERQQKREASTEQQQKQMAGVSLQENKEKEDQDGETKSSNETASDSALKIAFRYDKMKAFSTSVGGSSSNSASAFTRSGSSEAAAAAASLERAEQESQFCAQFDLSRRVRRATLAKAREEDRLFTLDLHDERQGTLSEGEEEQDPFQRARAFILARVDAIKAHVGQTGVPIALRISLPNFASDAWQRKRRRLEEHADFVRSLLLFTVQLRSMLRALALPEPDSPLPPIPAIATLNLSASFISSLPHCASPEMSPHAILQRLLVFSDAGLSLSSFAVSPRLSRAFPDYTGSVQVLKTPAIGTLVDISVRASILRGMSPLSAGTSGAGSGGAGGGENNLAFKLKRKRIVIETLHLDVDGGGKGSSTADRTPSKPPPGAGVAEPRAAPNVVHEPPRPLQPSQALPSGPVTESSASPSSAPAPKPGPFTSFGGMKSLRERGKQLQQESQRTPTTTSGSSTKGLTPVSHLDIGGDDQGFDDASSMHSPQAGKASTQKAVFKTRNPKDIEF